MKIELEKFGTLIWGLNFYMKDTEFYFYILKIDFEPMIKNLFSEIILQNLLIRVNTAINQNRNENEIIFGIKFLKNYVYEKICDILLRLVFFLYFIIIGYTRKEKSGWNFTNRKITKFNEFTLSWSF